MKNTKKLLALMVALVLISALAACGGSKSDTSVPEGPATEEIPLAIELTIPAAFFEESGGDFIISGDGLKAGDDLSDYIRENEFIDAHWNDDGSLTVAMSLLRFESFKNDMIDNTSRALSDLVEDDEYPFVVGFEATEEFKIVTMLVDRTGYENGGMPAAFLPILVGVTVGMYRGFVGEDEYYSVIIADAETGEKIERIEFPLEGNQ